MYVFSVITFDLFTRKRGGGRRGEVDAQWRNSMLLLFIPLIIDTFFVSVSALLLYYAFLYLDLNTERSNPQLPTLQSDMPRP